MPLFKCRKCGMVENEDNLEVLANVLTKKGFIKHCSLCHPAVRKWHGMFVRAEPEYHGLVEGPDGYLHGKNDAYFQRLKKAWP